MGRDIHVKILKKNKNLELWEPVVLYKKENGEFKEINFITYRDQDLFNILLGDSDTFFPFSPLNEANIAEPLRKEIEKKRGIIGYYGFCEANLADVRIYLQENPKIKSDYTEEEIINPVEHLVDIVYKVLNIAQEYDVPWYDSQIRIIYWFDC